MHFAPRLAESVRDRYIAGVKRLTRQEQLVLCSIIGLLLAGLLVKFFRAQQPPDAPAIQAKP